MSSRAADWILAICSFMGGDWIAETRAGGKGLVKQGIDGRVGSERDSTSVSYKNFDAFRRNFPGKLRFWALHCTINALPSYLIAVVLLGLWPVMHAHWAMLAAVCTFIIGYAVFTSWVPILREGRNLFTRALKVGLVIRTVISVITLIAVPMGPVLLFTPDLWCGLWANAFVSWVLGSEPLAQRVGGSASNSDVGFFEIYATTLVEGLILSFLLFILSFIAIIILQMRDRRNPLLWQGKPNP